MAGFSLARQHLNEAVDLLSTTTGIAILYTFVFIIYWLSFRLCYAQLRDSDGKIKRQTVCTLVFQTVLLICATLDIIVQNRTVQVLYIDNSALPGGPLGHQAALPIAPLEGVVSVVGFVENLLILGVLLWRVRVVWSGTCFVIPLTILSVIFYLGNAGLVIFTEVITWNTVATNLADIPQVQSMIVIMTFVFSIGGLIFMASTIIARLLFIRQKHIKLMGKSDTAGQYLGIAAMLIESYSLDALWNIGTLISYGLKYSPTQNLFNNCVIQVDILSNFLLIYRVLSGRAWDRQTQDRLSTLRWASSGTSTTTVGMVDLRPTDTIAEGGPPVISFRDRV